MRYLILIALLLTANAHAAADIVDLTEGPPGAKDKFVNVIEVDGAIKGEEYTACLSATGCEVKFTPRVGEAQSARLYRAAKTIKAFAKQLEKAEEAAAKALKNKPKPPVLKELMPNKQPIPKTTSGRTSDEATWYSKRSDDLVMYCPLPSLPRLSVEQISQR